MEHKGTVVGFTDVKQHIEFLLSQPGLEGVVNLSKNAILLFSYGDLAPFLKWSRYYSGITSLRVKIVEPNSHLSLIITLAVYLGDDNYDNLKPCFQLLYKQLSKLKCVKLYGKQISVLYRCWGMGSRAERRLAIHLQSQHSQFLNALSTSNSLAI